MHGYDKSRLITISSAVSSVFTQYLRRWGECDDTLVCLFFWCIAQCDSRFWTRLPSHRGNLLLHQSGNIKNRFMTLSVEYSQCWGPHCLLCSSLSLNMYPWIAVFFPPWIGLVWWGLERSAHRCQQGLLWDDTSCSDLPKFSAKLLVINRRWKKHEKKFHHMSCRSLKKMKLIGFTRGQNRLLMWWGRFLWSAFVAWKGYNRWHVVSMKSLIADKNTSENIKELLHTSWIDVFLSSFELRWDIKCRWEWSPYHLHCSMLR